MVSLLVAFVVLVVSGAMAAWPKNERLVRVLFGVLMILGTIGVWAGYQDKKQADQFNVQILGLEKENTELQAKSLQFNQQEEQIKEAKAQANQKIIIQLSALLKSGTRIRDRDCNNIDTPKNLEWTKRVEFHLRQINPVDEAVFRNADVELICYQSMGTKLATLEKIMDKYR